jgi:dipeptidyl aminopeptidase/acylaminoacyl peptidase
MPAGARRSVGPDDLTKLRGVGDPQISPDGTRVAFVVTTASEERDEYLSNIWVVATDGGEPRRFTTGSTRDTHPRWSPDGHWLAFVSDRGAKKDRSSTRCRRMAAKPFR